MTRIFSDSPAVRSASPLLIGIVAPSGAGKTYSALRLATGMQRICGGDVFGLDTETGRMLKYAEHFKFRHVPFVPPFGPLDYLDALEYCVSRGAKTVVVDSMSHEHIGPGGVLEMHEEILDKIAGNDWKKRERSSMLAWSKPKQQRTKLLQAIVQMGINVVFCFRAKEKIKPVKGGEPLQLGWMPLAGDEFIYEMDVCALLYPEAKGVPVWQPRELGEQGIVKLPEQLRAAFAAEPQLSEDAGERLARWAAGGNVEVTKRDKLGDMVSTMLADYGECDEHDVLEAIQQRRAELWPQLRGRSADQAALKQAAEQAAERVAQKEQ